jgi:hypothetical protein
MIFYTKIHIMPTKLHLILCLSLISWSSHAQITLESLDGKSTKRLKPGSTVAIKLPAPSSANKDCDCYKEFEGLLRETIGDSAVLELHRSERYSYEENGIMKKEETEYRYWDYKVKTSKVPLTNALAISKISESKKDLKMAGGVFMLLAGTHAVFTAPLFRGNARKVSDYITWSTFGAGFIMAIVPAKKTYHLQQPKSGEQRLWKIKSPINTN